MDKHRKATYHLWTFAMSKLISSFGSSVYGFGMSLYILNVTGSATGFAINLLCNTLPRAILAPFAGTLADRKSKKKIVLISQGGASVIVLSLLGFSFIQELYVSAIYTTTALLSICSTFTSITLTSSITQLFNQEKLQKAMAFQQASISLSTIGGPIVGGALFGLFSMKVFLLIHISSYIIAILLEATMNFTLYRKQPFSKPSPFRQSLLEGLRYVKSNENLLRLFCTGLVVNFFAVSLVVGLPFIAVEKLRIQSAHFGIIEGTFAAGMLVTSIYFSIRKSFRSPLLLTKWGIVVASFIMVMTTLPLFIPLSYGGNVSFYMVIGLIYGITLTFVNTPLGVLLQNVIEDEVKGRVFGILEMMAQGLSPLGMIIYGLALDTIGPGWSIIPSSFCMTAFTLLLLNQKRLKYIPTSYSSIS
ncbi:MULTISPECIES: MFS transporter [Pontibacillus]|uniref:MFS transporter n=1 Tax=Pontibacillus chungwhensis TaxID=265426 RepID=A0ABY8USC3_9BACI|nr:MULTISPECIES: MFS transporter [Pontibacillus]MCD5323185.1 MFS transporter [Pontibacillus sp. HN14]WIF96572.1 MFS transporter [Pontibacillus chungwhensis]